MDEETTVDQQLVTDFVKKISAQRVAAVNLGNVIKGQKFEFLPATTELKKADNQRPTVMFKSDKAAYPISFPLAASLRILNNLTEQDPAKAVDATAMVKEFDKKYKVFMKLTNKLSDSVVVGDLMTSIQLPGIGVMNLQAFGNSLEDKETVLDYFYMCIGHVPMMNVQDPTKLVYEPYCYKKADEFYQERAKITTWNSESQVERDEALTKFNEIRGNLQKSGVENDRTTFINILKLPVFIPIAKVSQTGS